MTTTISFLIGILVGFLLGNNKTRNWLVSMANRTQKPAPKKRTTNRKSTTRK